MMRFRFDIFRVPLLVGIALIIAFVGGTWSAQWALSESPGVATLRIGSWTTNPNIQSKAADPYAKAYRANKGQLLLGRAEGLMFSASTDASGDALKSNCIYALSGTVPAALFWTLRTTSTESDAKPEMLTAKGGEYNPTSINSHKALRTANGHIDIIISPNAQAGNWLTPSVQGDFKLIMTLIDASTANQAGLSELKMPVIERRECVNV